jgi:predicted NAD-dependent protein-ADP-ribosyltransferase YbiA (DUF1768 family)
MTNTIELFNPNDKPFGQLGNNAYHPMTINGKKYDTVTNYIYSNMLTTSMFRTIVQNTKIKGIKVINKELIEAIDFLINEQIPNKSGPNMISTSKYMGVDQKQEKIRYLVGVTKKPADKFKKMSEKKLNKTYKKYLKPYEQVHSEEDIQKAWIDYAKTGKIKELDDISEKRRNNQIMISNKVRQPFESVNLLKLKQDLESESNINQMDIYKVYNDSKHNELFDVISESVRKGYESRFQNPDLQKILMGTGNFPIQYESTDNFLGIGTDGMGSNLVGKVIMQIRHNLRVRRGIEDTQVEEQIKYKRIYDIYLAYIILRKEMSDNKKQLDDYLGLDTNQIINKYGIGNLVKGIPTQETIMELYKRDNLNSIVMKEIYQPGTMVINMRKTGLRQLKHNLEKDKIDIIFNSYLEYIIKKNFDYEIKRESDIRFDRHKNSGISDPDKNIIRIDIIEEIIARQKAKLTPDQKDNTQNRVVDLFKLGMLSASLSDKIDKEINELQIPTDEEINEAEIAEIQPTHTEKVEDNDEDISSTTSSLSSDGSPVTKRLKNVFRDDKMKKTDIIDIIIKKKGGYKEDYDDWSVKKLKQRLDTIEIEQMSASDDNYKLNNKETSFIYIPPSGQPIGIFKQDESNSPELRSFNPESYTGMLSIDHLYYPTIQHYIITRLIANTGTKRKVDSYGVATFEKGMGINSAHKTVLLDSNTDGHKPEDFLTIQLISETYDKIEYDTNTMLLSMHTATSLNKKFEDRSLQDLLILTGDKEIRWNTPENYYLGYGTDDSPGKNYVGLTMMDIREKIRVIRVDQEEVNVELDDLIKFVNKDSFIMSWVEMRVKDMCGVVYKLQQYLINKDGINIDLNEEEMLVKLVNFTLDTVYQPCNSLVSMSNKVDIPVPKFFVNIVDKCKGLNSGIPELTKTDNKGNIRYNKEIEENRLLSENSINQLESDFWGGSRIDHTKEESQEFAKYQQDEWIESIQEINQSEEKQEEKNKSIENFKIHQKEEYNDFWGIVKGIKTKDEISKHEHEIKELKREFSEYIRKAERVQKHYFLVMKGISQIYWNHIVVMLSTLIQNIKPSTASNIRDALVKIEMFNSEKANCTRIIVNEQENCIVSAILNLLVGIQKFKQEFSGNLDLDIDDITLAGSIILNNEFQPTYVNVDDPEQDSDRELDLDVDESFDVNPSGSFPSDRDSGDEMDGDYGDEYEENPYFAMKTKNNGRKYVGSVGDLAKIEQQLLLLGVSDSNSLAISIMKTVQIIKNSNISPKIKQNRINFFATIR